MEVVKQLKHLALTGLLLVSGSLCAFALETPVALTDQAIFNHSLTQAAALAKAPSVATSLQQSSEAVNLFADLKYELSDTAVTLQADQLQGQRTVFEVHELFSDEVAPILAEKVNEKIDEDATETNYHLNATSEPTISVTKNNIQIAVQKHPEVSEPAVQTGILEPASPLSAALLQSSKPGQLARHDETNNDELEETSSEARGKKRNSELRVAMNEGVLSVTPPQLTLTRPEVIVTLQDGMPLSYDDLQIFIRDPKLARWDLTAKKILMNHTSVAASEIYIVANGQMAIIPFAYHPDDVAPELPTSAPEADLLAQLDQKFQTPPLPQLADMSDLELPGVLTDLQSTATPLNEDLNSAAHVSTAGGSSREMADLQVAKAVTEVAEKTLKAATSANGGLSVSESRTQTALSQARRSARMSRYQVTTADAKYQTLTLQILDERSLPEQSIIYPLPNLNVKLNGAEFSAKTDASGHVTFRDVPVGARLLIDISDPEGFVRTTTYELHLSDDSVDSVVRLKAVRQHYFDAITSVLRTAQHAALSSMCGHITSSGKKAEGIQVVLDVEAEGPYYFNQYGHLDPGKQATGVDGRFCYINVDPGPAALSVYRLDEQGSQFVSTQMVPLFAGRHTEEQVDLDSAVVVSTHLAAMATAHEQLGQDLNAANALSPVDMIDLIPLGTDTYMTKTNDGEVETTLEIIPSKGRVFSFAQASEFEPVVYSMATRNDQAGVTPLMARGFMEDLSYYAQVNYNATMGSVILEHAAFAGQDQQSVNVKLLDIDGRSVSEAWYYADNPTAKAVFFNVTAGVYTVLVESMEGFWLASDTVFVYSEATSYIHTGSPLIYAP